MRVLSLLIAGLLLAGGGSAFAAWSTSSTGTATGHAGTMGVPGTVTVGRVTCSGTVTVTAAIPVSWTAVPGARQYVAELSRTADFSLLAASSTVSTTSTTFDGLTLGTVYARVRASAGNWVGATSEPVRAEISC